MPLCNLEISVLKRPAHGWAVFATPYYAGARPGACRWRLWPVGRVRPPLVGGACGQQQRPLDDHDPGACAAHQRRRARGACREPCRPQSCTGCSGPGCCDGRARFPSAGRAGDAGGDGAPGSHGAGCAAPHALFARRPKAGQCGLPCCLRPQPRALLPTPVRLPCSGLTLAGVPAQADAHEQQRRALLADAYSLASEGQGEEEDMEAVMEDLEELSRTMAQFKELSHRQRERIERYARAMPRGNVVPPHMLHAHAVRKRVWRNLLIARPSGATSSWTSSWTR